MCIIQYLVTLLKRLRSFRTVKTSSHPGLNREPLTLAISALPPELWPPGDSQPSQFSISLCMCRQKPVRDQPVTPLHQGRSHTESSHILHPSSLPSSSLPELQLRGGSSMLSTHWETGHYLENCSKQSVLRGKPRSVPSATS